MRSTQVTRVGFVAVAMVALLSLGAGPAVAQETSAVDKAINDALGPFASWIAGIVFWAPPIENFPPLIVLWMVAAGVFFTFYLRWINLRGLKHSVDIVRGAYDNPDDPGETTHFQALMTALSATVGLGNIAGVAVAISIGGPGATFWMIVAAIFGMTLKFTECSLAVKYRNEWPDGQVSGGPMYYLDIGLREKGWPTWAAKFCAGFFAFATVGAAIGAANMFKTRH
jgi:AGCS family alanine or glycine:cation symporter